MPHIPGIFLLLQRDYPIKRIVLNFKRNFFEEMQTLNLPQAAVKITEKAGKRFIFDPIRKKYVALTPEEWVRQHCIHFLVSCKGYPVELVANEVSITLNKTSKRCDSVVYNNYLEPLVIIEYKAPSVPITAEVFNQIARYNMALHVKYLIVSNGLQHYCCKIDYNSGAIDFHREIPSYAEIVL